jgi:protein TonB
VAVAVNPDLAIAAFIPLPGSPAHSGNAMSMSLAAPSAAPLSPRRVFAIAAALVVHVGAFALLIAPPRRPEAAPATPPPRIEVTIQERPILPPPAPPLVPLTPPRPTPVRQPVARAQPVVIDNPEPAISMADVVPEITPSLDALDSGLPATDGAAFGAEQIGSAEYLDAPRPRYPLQAKKRGLEGDVLLLVTIGSNGRPEDVSLYASSGHTVLDRAALETVQRCWRFRPLMVGGMPTRSRALVPIRFELFDR